MEYLGPGYEDVSPQAAAGILAERLKNAGDIGDRRDALEALLKLSEDYPTDVGKAGMPTLTDILQAGIADGAMTQAILEIMLNLVAEREGSDGTGGNVSSFLEDVQNVQNMLDLLESQDLITALSAVQVLQALQKSSPDSLEVCVLECPAGLQALVEVLRDPREEIRNEVILLLGQMTSSNLEVKKFVAFQEGFERLFDIMSSEGMLEEGSVIVKDCLHVCLNIIDGSSLTKALFCESSCLKRFHRLIDVRTAVAVTGVASEGHDTGSKVEESSGVGGGEEIRRLKAEVPSMSAMQTEIACKALDLLLLLLSCDAEDARDGKEGDDKRPERQSIVAGVEEGLLSEMLAHVAFSRADTFCHAPKECRERAMRVTGALVEGHSINQYNTGEILVQDLGLDSVSLATLVVLGALGEGGADPSLNGTYNWVLDCFFQGNELICTQAFSYVITPPPPPLELEDIEAWIPPTSPGKALLDYLAASAQILFGGDSNRRVGSDTDQQEEVERRNSAVAHAADVMSRGCIILSMLLTHGGGLAKEISLRVPVALTLDGLPTTLLNALLCWLELATFCHHPPTTTQDVIGSTKIDGSFNPVVAKEDGSAESVVFSAVAGRPATPDSFTESENKAREAFSADAAVSLLRLLCTWVYGCPAAVHELLGNPANLFVVEVAAGRYSLVVKNSGNGAGMKTAKDRVAKGVTSAQYAALEGLACLMLGLLLEYVEGSSAPKSGGSSGEWTRDLVMKMIQKRIGITTFMASIEASKRAFVEADADQRRRQRAGRARKGSGGAGQGQGLSGGVVALRLDPSFSPMLDQASGEVRRRVISIFTHGGKDAAGEDEEKTSPDTKEEVASGAGLASIVDAQEQDIAGLQKELSEALSRVPRGGGERGGISVLEEALRNQVGELEAVGLAQSKETDELREKLNVVRREADAETESGKILTLELQGLSLTVGSLERQLLDREESYERLKRQLDAKGDRSEREKDLARQVDEACARALEAEETLDRSQRLSMADAAADEADQEAKQKTEAKLSAQEARMTELQVAVDEARAEVDTMSTDSKALLAELASTVNELESGQKALSEWETRVQELERALAEKGEEAEVNKRQTALLQQTADAAQLYFEERQETAAAAELRRTEEVDRMAAETEALRQQLSSAVQSLAEASSGGDQQVKALQKELAAAREREEQDATEWRRRVEKGCRETKEEAARFKRVLEQTEKKVNDHWTLQLQDKEAAASRLAEELKLSTEAVESATKTSCAKAARLEEENARLKDQADRAESLVARCARLEEAAASAGADAEERLREEMERERDLTLRAERLVSELEARQAKLSAELAGEGNVVAELRSRLDEVQVYLAQSEEDREAAVGREALALSRVKELQQAIRTGEENLKHAVNDLEDRDGVIAAVEDARAAQEREAEHLRDKLRGLGKLLSPPRELNSKAGIANGNGHVRGNGAWGGADSRGEGAQDQLAEGEEYLELLSEHEDLLQLLAQQEVVRKKLLNALMETAGQGAARAVIKDAEAEVAESYGCFVSYTDDQDLFDAHLQDERSNSSSASTGEPRREGPAGRRRTVAV